MENKQSKISTSFKIFISLILLIGLSVLGYSLVQQGESLPRVIALLLAVIGAVGLFLIGGIKIFKRLKNLSDLSPAEETYAKDLSKSKFIITLFKDLSSGTSTAVNFLVILGYMVKWLLFWIFAGSSLMLLIQGTSLFDTLIILCLTITWCPWLE